MKILPLMSSIKQPYFYGSKKTDKQNKKCEKLPDYQSYYREKNTYGSIGVLPENRAKNVLERINNEDLKIFTQNFYDTEHYLSPNMAGFILGMDAGLDNIKDKYLKKEIHGGLRALSKTIKDGGSYFECDTGINLISNIIDSYNTLNGIYSRYYIPSLNLDVVKYKNSPSKYYLEKLKEMKIIFKETQEDLEDIFNNNKLHTCRTHAKAVVENQRIEPFSYIAKYREISDYIYVKYYLNTNKIHPEIRKMCLDILDKFGTQVILPYPDKKRNISDLQIIKKELALWDKYGKDDAIFPHFINLSYINNQYTDENAVGYYSHALDGIFLDMNIKDSLRHEMTHLNDRLLEMDKTNDREFIKLLKSIMPSKTIIRNGVRKSVPDFENCKYREEFLKAGVFPSDIKYAYTNKKEFIAVASQGDMSQYSDEFKNVLVKMGLPEFALKLPQTNNDIISNVNQVKRVMKKHPECKDYNGILQYCEY